MASLSESYRKAFYFAQLAALNDGVRYHVYGRKTDNGWVYKWSPTFQASRYKPLTIDTESLKQWH